jgi:hypothetical protein
MTWGVESSDRKSPLKPRLQVVLAMRFLLVSLRLVSIRYKTVFQGSEPPSRGRREQENQVKSDSFPHETSPRTGTASVLYRELVNGVGF